VTPQGARNSAMVLPKGRLAENVLYFVRVLRAAGLTNASDGRRIGLEGLLRHPPDLLVVATAPGYPSLASELLDHPALADLPRRAIPPALTICAGPFTARAAALLAR